MTRLSILLLVIALIFLGTTTPVGCSGKTSNNDVSESTNGSQLEEARPSNQPANWVTEEFVITGFT